jgi:preprotein translocase subunit SecY
MRKLWQRVPLAVAGLGVLVIASRIAIPGVDPDVMRRVVSDGGMLRLYDLIGGGGMARSGILALGVVPYLAAKLWIWISRLGNTGARSSEDRRRMLRDTRLLTVALSLIQSYGFAVFAERLPGAVAQPGPEFVLQTMAILTLTTLAAMTVMEQLTPPDDEDDDLDAVAADLLGSGAAQPVELRADAKSPERSP